jgi:hypothetical protein
MRLLREVAAFVIAIASVAAAAACSSAGDAAAPDVDAGAASLIPGRACPSGSTLTYESFGEPFFNDWCTGCHSSALSADARRGAPVGVDYDSLAGIRAHLPQIWARAADNNATMPPAGGPTAPLRQSLGDWVACGAPGTDNGFDAATDDASAPALPTGACAAPRSPLAASLLPRCAASTLACIAACTTSNCQNQCLANDPTPKDPATQLDCNACYFDQLIACADPQCHGPIAEFFCCVANKCAGGDASCPQTQCSAESEAFSLCLYYVTPGCLTVSQPDIAACFAPAPPDSGVADAGDGG